MLMHTVNGAMFTTFLISRDYIYFSTEYTNHAKYFILGLK